MNAPPLAGAGAAPDDAPPEVDAGRSGARCRVLLQAKETLGGGDVPGLEGGDGFVLARRLAHAAGLGQGPGVVDRGRRPRRCPAGPRARTGAARGRATRGPAARGRTRSRFAGPRGRAAPRPPAATPPRGNCPARAAAGRAPPSPSPARIAPRWWDRRWARATGCGEGRSGGMVSAVVWPAEPRRARPEDPSARRTRPRSRPRRPRRRASGTSGAGGGGEWIVPGMASGRPRRGSWQREHSARRALLRFPHFPQMRK